MPKNYWQPKRERVKRPTQKETKELDTEIQDVLDQINTAGCPVELIEDRVSMFINERVDIRF